MEAQTNTLTIILGAGASYDCADRTTANQVNVQWRPPLAREIFAQRFDGILNWYPLVTARLDELRTKLAKNGNFEELFRDLLESAERNQAYWPLQVPLYIRHLFWTISQDYYQGSSKFDTLVRCVLESSFERIMFINLNYDLFLEDALTNYDRHEFDTLGSYAPKSKKWLFVKPHGSVNWAKVLKDCPRASYGSFLPTQLEKMPIFSSELVVVNWHRHHHTFEIPGDGPDGYLYPQLVIPTDRPKEFVCPQDQVDQAKTVLQACGKFLLIGFSGRDGDVVELLRSIPNGSCLEIVSDSKREAREVFKRMSSRVPSLASMELELSFHGSGFSKFLESEAFGRFCG